MIDNFYKSNTIAVDWVYLCVFGPVCTVHQNLSVQPSIKLVSHQRQSR